MNIPPEELDDEESGPVILTQDQLEEGLNNGSITVFRFNPDGTFIVPLSEEDEEFFAE